MLRIRYLALLAATAAAAIIVPASASAAPVSPARPAVVLMNFPARSVCVGHRFTVGVYYQHFSRGSRRYRVDVYNPHGKRVLYQHGSASGSAWKVWKVRTKLAGRYRTVYWTHHPGSSRWSADRFRTTARRC